MVSTRVPTLGDELESGPGKRIVFLRTVGGEQPADDYLRALPAREEAKFRAQFRNMAERGCLPREQFSKVEHNTGGIWAFRTRDHVLLCFHDVGRVIVLVGGARTGKRSRSILERAKRLHEEYRGTKVRNIGNRRTG